MAAIDINSIDFEDKVLGSEKYVLVDFWAPWCGPCRAMAPVLDELSQDDDFGGNLEVMKINIDEPQNQQLAILFGVRGIPNMKLFHKGELVNDYVGMRPKEMIKNELLEALK